MKQKQRYKTHKHKSYYKEGNGLARQNLLYTTGEIDTEQSDTNSGCTVYRIRTERCEIGD